MYLISRQKVRNDRATVHLKTCIILFYEKNIYTANQSVNESLNRPQMHFS